MLNMLNNKLLVFLHGFGSDKNENRQVLQSLANQLWLDDYLAFDAKFPSGRSRGGFWRVYLTEWERKWIFDDWQFDESIRQINDTIELELQKRNLKWSDVILCGRSQWWLMSMFIGLTGSHKISAIVSICSNYHSSLTDEFTQSVPVIWIEWWKDDHVSDDKKQTYKKLQSKWINVEYIVDETTDHEIISEVAVTKISEALKKYCF